MYYGLGLGSPDDKPLWPFVIGLAVVVGSLSYVSLKGQAEIHARIEREHRARGTMHGARRRR
jgi:hypothetical protein